MGNWILGIIEAFRRKKLWFAELLSPTIMTAEYAYELFADLPLKVSVTSIGPAGRFVEFRASEAIRKELEKRGIFKAIRPSKKYYALTFDKKADFIISIRQTLAKIGMDKVWKDPDWDGGKDIIFGINDTGIDMSDPYYGKAYFEGRVLEQYTAPGISPTSAKHRHARLVCAVMARAQGGEYRGICDKAKIYDGRSLDSQGGGSTGTVVAVFNWLAERNPRPHIINASLGGPHDQALDDAVKRLWDLGIIVVCATGNNGVYPPACDGRLNCPADAPETVAVGATDGGKEQEGQPEKVQTWTARNPDSRGRTQQHYLVAPGYGVLVGDGEGPASGTSLASPHVAGVLGVIRKYLRNPSPQQAIEILEKTCLDLGYKVEESKCVQGHGRIRADKAKEKAKEGGSNGQPKITKVEFFLDSKLIATVTDPVSGTMYQASFTVAVGEHDFYARAWSNEKNQLSKGVPFTVFKEESEMRIICNVLHPRKGDRIGSKQNPIIFQVEARVETET